MSSWAVLNINKQGIHCNVSLQCVQRCQCPMIQTRKSQIFLCVTILLCSAPWISSNLPNLINHKLKSYPKGPIIEKKTLLSWNPLTQFKMHTLKVCRHLTMFTTTLEFSSWKSNACMVITSNLLPSLYKASAPYLTRERERALQGLALHWRCALEGPWCGSAGALFRRRRHLPGPSRWTHSRGSFPSLFFELDLD